MDNRNKQNHKGTIIFKCFAQTSHYNSTWRLAGQLQEEGFKILYMATDPMKSIIQANGFEYFLIHEEDDLMEKEIQTPPLRSEWIYHLKSLRHLALIRRQNSGKMLASVKKDHFSKPIHKYNPILFILDSSHKILGLELIKLGMPFLIINTTVSLIKGKFKPPISSAIVPTGSIFSAIKVSVAWMLYRVKIQFLGILYNQNWHQALLWLCQEANYNLKDLDQNRFFGFGFREIPELNTSPVEFDFPHKIPENIHYIGPPIWEKRSDISCDYSYFQSIEEIKKNMRYKIYCSFGTRCWRYFGYAEFLKKLCEAVSKMTNCDLILTVEDDRLRRTLREKAYNNIHIFRRVPQLELLKCIDLMITHGGMNSIVECIFANVPMLVYPGSDQVDQYGNSARVAYHEIGLKGRYSDSIATITKKVTKILGDQKFKRNVAKMNALIHKNRNFDKGVKFVVDFIKTNEKLD